jgi:DNA-binding transcriptional ArsR family regulator
MPSGSKTADLAFEALADPTRRRVFRLLAGSECSVGELASHLPVSRPAVSQHLKVLKEAGLVSDRPDGVRRLYSVHPTGLEALRAELESMWDHALGAFAASAERATGDEPSKASQQDRGSKRRKRSER